MATTQRPARRRPTRTRSATSVTGAARVSLKLTVGDDEARPDFGSRYSPVSARRGVTTGPGVSGSAAGGSPAGGGGCGDGAGAPATVMPTVATFESPLEFVALNVS